MWGGHASGAGSLTRTQVYVGDSATDLTALLEADVGVLVGESATAREIAARFSVRLEPLEARRPPFLDRSGIVWLAASWAEIAEHLL